MILVMRLMVVKLIQLMERYSFLYPCVHFLNTMHISMVVIQYFCQDKVYQIYSRYAGEVDLSPRSLHRFFLSLCRNNTQ